MSEQREQPEPVPYESKRPKPALELTCPKCGSRMVQGVTLDGHGARASWIAGRMRRGWLGFPILPKGEMSTIVTYRCVGCGFLESYGSTG